MRKFNIKLWISLLFTLAGVLSNGCSEKKTVEKPTTAAGEVVEGYQLSIGTVKKKYFSAAEPINLNVTLKNVLPESGKIVGKGLSDMYKIEITNASGQKPGQTALGLRHTAYDGVGSNREKTVKPNEEIDVIFHLNRLYDMSLLGEYKVTVIIRVWKRKNEDEFATVKSNTLVLTIVEPTDEKKESK